MFRIPFKARDDMRKIFRSKEHPFFLPNETHNEDFSPVDQEAKYYQSSINDHIIVDNYIKPPPKSVVFSSDTKPISNTFCNPGPKPLINKRDNLTYYEYLSNYESSRNTRYGCNKGQYIKYEDGHYCCVKSDKRATPQEMIDFINMLLKSFIKNVGYSRAPNAIVNRSTSLKYKQSLKDLKFIMGYREFILQTNPTILDNFVMPIDMPTEISRLPENEQLNIWVQQYSMPEEALSDKLTNDPQDNESAILTKMRGEVKPTGEFLYTRNKSGNSRFGGKKSKTIKNKKTNNKTSKKRMNKVHIWAHKRPWRVTYRNKDGERTTNILKNGTEKNKLIKQIEKDNLHIYGINNLTDKQIQIYASKGLL